MFKKKILTVSNLMNSMVMLTMIFGVFFSSIYSVRYHSDGVVKTKAVVIWIHIARARLFIHVLTIIPSHCYWKMEFVFFFSLCRFCLNFVCVLSITCCCHSVHYPCHVYAWLSLYDICNMFKVSSISKCISNCVFLIWTIALIEKQRQEQRRRRQKKNELKSNMQLYAWLQYLILSYHCHFF